jgi:hypothetical protein
VDHPLGCHRPRVPDRIVFDKLVQVLVFGCAYERIADASCAYDQMIGLELGDLAVDGCITKAPCGGEVAGKSPVDRGKQELKRSTVVDANGIPLGAIAAPANRHDSPLLQATLATLDALGPLPDAATVHLNRGYDSARTLERLAARGLAGAIAPTGKPAPIAASARWPVERTNAWTNAHKKLVWCTERRDRLIAFWLAFSAVIIIVRRLVRECWTRYRWSKRPARKP